MLERLRSGYEDWMVVECIHQDNHRREGGKLPSFFTLVQLPSDKGSSPSVVIMAAHTLCVHVRRTVAEKGFELAWKSGMLLDLAYERENEVLCSYECPSGCHRTREGSARPGVRRGVLST